MTFVNPLGEGARTVLFFRNFQKYSGGHQKVADYFGHLQSAIHFSPAISFSSTSIWSPANPWLDDQDKQVEFEPKNYDALFLAGLDWQQYECVGIDPAQPVINLIQHVRHADPATDLYPFLKYQAIRICVSSQVAQAINATGVVNGPVLTIANGHKMPEIPAAGKKIDLLIVGSKRPQLADNIAMALAGEMKNIHVFNSFVPRQQLLETMARARVVLCLPNPTEGFYLPALEAMKYAELAIVPDCVGNRSFCHDHLNCLRPDYVFNELLRACREGLAWADDKQKRLPMQCEARKTINDHSLARERAEFLAIMNNIDKLWK